MMLAREFQIVKRHLGIWLDNPSLTALIVFLLCGLRHLDLPGLYMDSVNPDYLAAHALHPHLDNFRALLPRNTKIIFLGNYYRSSNTEPLLRLNVEARGDTALMQRRVGEISVLIAGS